MRRTLRGPHARSPLFHVVTSRCGDLKYLYRVYVRARRRAQPFKGQRYHFNLYRRYCFQREYSKFAASLRSEFTLVLFERIDSEFFFFRDELKWG